MAKFESKDGKLFIDGKEVLYGWESFGGFYWFAVEKIEERKVGVDGGGSLIDGKEVDDVIWFGFVQMLEEEWGDFSQAEIASLGSRAWKIPQKNLPFSGRRR